MQSLRMGSALFSYSYWCQVTSALYKQDTSLSSLRRTVWAVHEDVRLRVPCEQWFLQAGRCATKVEKPMRATVCFSIEHGNSRDAYVKTSNAITSSCFAGNIRDFKIQRRDGNENVKRKQV